MALTVTELLESRSVAKKGGRLTASRSFHVYDADSAIQTPGRLIASFGSSGLPQYGEQFPESSSLFARDYDISLVSGHNDLWIIRWEYAELEISGGVEIPEIEPGQPNYVELSATISMTKVATWRTFTAAQIRTLVSAEGSTQLFPNGSVTQSRDIGGQPVDINGEPIETAIPQVEITITEVAPGVPNLSGAMSFIWHRNSTAFLGAPIGQLLYAGVTVNRIGVNMFQYAHKFILDRWYFMRQTPLRNSLGEVQPADNPIVPSGGGSPYNVAKTVFFVQAFPDYANFFNISPNFRRADSAPRRFRGIDT